MKFLLVMAGEALSMLLTLSGELFQFEMYFAYVVMNRLIILDSTLGPDLHPYIPEVLVISSDI